MATRRELADRAVVSLLKHIEKNGAKSMNYAEFSRMFGWFDKNGNPQANGAGAVLGKIMVDLQEFDSKAPYISVLVYSQSTGQPSTGLSHFVKGWDKMSDAEKDEYVTAEKRKIEKYSKAGKFQQFAFATMNKRNIDFEFPSQKGTDNYTVADGISIQKHRAVEYRIRNEKIVCDKKKRSDYKCECCSFDFGKVYGELGRNFIECHHIKPLAASKSGAEIGLKDLAVLCSNCHRIIHKLLSGDKDKYANNYNESIADLKRIVKENR